MTDNSNNQNLPAYNNKNLKIEKNSFNYDNDIPPIDYSLKALKKLDMEHATNNYYNNQVEPPKAYKVFVRRDKKPDFDNYKHFNDYVEFDSEKYQRPEIYYGFVHDQYLMPQILYGNTKNDKQKEGGKLEDKNQNEEKIIKSDSKKIKNNKKEKTNTVKSLDDIMNKFNLKYIEPPPKEKKVEPPPEEVLEEEEEVKDSKDKNKAKKDSANKSKIIKDDKSKNAKTSKK